MTELLLLTECDLQAVISLPSGVFKPYAGVATAVNHDAPADILSDVLKVENEILQRGTALLKQFGDQP